MIKNCLVCKKEYSCKPYEINRSKYCSKACFNESKKRRPMTDDENHQILKNKFERDVIKNEGGCWNAKTPPMTSGYGQIRDGRGKNLTLHRASWMIHRGPIPNGKCVLHHCDNRICSRIDHLFLGSLIDNNKDMYKKGRGAGQFKREKVLGEKNSNSKLNIQNVLEIKKYLKNGKSIKQIRKLLTFYTTKYIIYDIKKGKTWSHVTIDEADDNSDNMPTIFDNTD